MIQGLPDIETLTGVQDDQLTDLTGQDKSLLATKVQEDSSPPISRTHQVLGIEGHLVPPRRHKLVVAVEDAAVHVLIPPRIEERFKATEPAERDQGLRHQRRQFGNILGEPASDRPATHRSRRF